MLNIPDISFSELQLCINNSSILTQLDNEKISSKLSRSENIADFNITQLSKPNKVIRESQLIMATFSSFLALIKKSKSFMLACCISKDFKLSHLNNGE